MVYEYKINGVSLKSGDIICTVDGDEGEWRGQVWRMIGRLLPDKVDHIAIYTGTDDASRWGQSSRSSSSMPSPSRTHIR